jgi:hypothetical protein
MVFLRKEECMALKILAVSATALLWATFAQAKVDMVSLPTRDHVQLTIYNSADLTLIRDQRVLTLRQGLNDLQFSWANTLIDPTSLEMTAKNSSGKVSINDLTFPPRVKDVGLWHIESSESGQSPVEISYLTSGLSWRAFYLGTLTPDESNMRLEGYVVVTNNSGEDYENAKVRLIVGQVHMIDEIAQLARSQYPYGYPGGDVYGGLKDKANYSEKRMEMKGLMAVAEASYDMAVPAAKEIVKEGLSEYFLYTIEGTETIPHGWAKRLPSFEAAAVPVVNLYKYEEEQYGDHVVRFLSFKNNKDHQLGLTPIPGGTIKAFRRVDEQNHLSYEGQSSFKYIPVDEDVELNLGVVETVLVKPVLMKYKTDNYRFNKEGNVIGWDETREFQVTVNNTRQVPVKVEIRRNLYITDWKIQGEGDQGKYEKIDADTIQYTLELGPGEKKEFKYTVTNSSPNSSTPVPVASQMPVAFSGEAQGAVHGEVAY